MKDERCLTRADSQLRGSVANSQKNLACRAGISALTLTRLEGGGTSEPTDETVQALANALDYLRQPRALGRLHDVVRKSANGRTPKAFSALDLRCNLDRLLPGARLPLHDLGQQPAAVGARLRQVAAAHAVGDGVAGDASPLAHLGPGQAFASHSGEPDHQSLDAIKAKENLLELAARVRRNRPRRARGRCAHTCPSRGYRAPQSRQSSLELESAIHARAYSGLMSGEAIVGTPCAMAASFWAAIALR